MDQRRFVWKVPLIAGEGTKRKGPPPTRIVTGLLEYTGRPTARLSGKLHGAMIVPSQQEATS